MNAAIRALLAVMKERLKLGGNPEDLPRKVKVPRKSLIAAAQTIDCFERLEETEGREERQ